MNGCREISIRDEVRGGGNDILDEISSVTVQENLEHHSERHSTPGWI